MSEHQLTHIEPAIENQVEGLWSVTEDPQGTLHLICNTGHILSVSDRQCQDYYNTSGSPLSMAFDKDGTGYICDQDLKALLRHLDSEGRVEQTPFVQEHERTPLLGPNNVVISDDGDVIYFTDSGSMSNCTLQGPYGSIFAADMGLRLLKPIILKQLLHPSGLALSSDGQTLYVAETLKNRVLRVCLRNNAIPQTSVFYQFNGRLGPTALAITENNTLYVALFDLVGCSARGQIAVIDQQGQIVRNHNLTCGPEITGLYFSKHQSNLLYVTEYSTMCYKLNIPPEDLQLENIMAIRRIRFRDERNKSLPRRRNRPLKEIVEDPEEFQKDHEYSRQASQSVILQTVRQIEYKPKPQLVFFQAFLSEMSKFSDIYNCLIGQCKSFGILQQRFMSPQKYYQGFLRQRVVNKEIKSSLSQPQIFTDEIANEAILETETDQLQQTIQLKILENVQRLNVQENQFDTASKNTDKTKSSNLNIQSKGGGKLRRVHSKAQILSVNDPKLIETFNSIARPAQGQKPHRVTINQTNFTLHLQQRYPDQLVEIFNRYFDFQKPLPLKQYHLAVEKFLQFQDDKHMKVCFDIYDLNKDRKICYSDTFQAIQIRTNNYSDRDLALIKDALNQKKENHLKQHKSNKKQYFSHTMQIVKPSISLKEFCNLDFSYKKPQIFYDFVEHISGLSINKHQFKHHQTTSRRDSEVIIEEMDYNVELLQELIKGPRYNYFTKLKDMQSQYSESMFSLLIQKFKILESDDFHDIRVITLDSFKQNYVIFKQPKLIGTSAQHFIERIYRVIAGPKYEDVTKLRFLTSLHPLLNGNKADRQSWLFQIFDSDYDEHIQISELIELAKSFQKGCAAYNEVKILINVINEALITKSRREIVTITFNQFSQLLPNSIILKYLIQSFTSSEPPDFPIPEIEGSFKKR